MSGIGGWRRYSPRNQNPFRTTQNPASLRESERPEPPEKGRSGRRGAGAVRLACCKERQSSGKATVLGQPVKAPRAVARGVTKQAALRGSKRSESTIPGKAILHPFQRQPAPTPRPPRGLPPR